MGWYDWVVLLRRPVITWFLQIIVFLTLLNSIKPKYDSSRMVRFFCKDARKAQVALLYPTFFGDGIYAIAYQ